MTVIVTNQARNSVSTTSQAKSQITTSANAGQYYGFGAFTYSGGQVLSTAFMAPTNLSRNLVTVTSLAKS